MTILDVFPAVKGLAQPVATSEGGCDPCFEQSAGFPYCDGSGLQFLEFGSGGNYVVVVENGVPRLRNASDFLNTTAPTDPGGGAQAAPDTSPIPADELPPLPEPAED